MNRRGKSAVPESTIEITPPKPTKCTRHDTIKKHGDWLNINGEMVPTMQAFYSQLMAHSCRVDRVSLQTKILYVIAAVELVAIILTR